LVMSSGQSASERTAPEDAVALPEYVTDWVRCPQPRLECPPMLAGPCGPNYLFPPLRPGVDDHQRLYGTAGEA
jgi:hypothetical protein